MAPAPTDPKSGRVGHLTDQQKETLDKFRQRLKEKELFVPERHDDATLLRFLRARKFDLEAAFTMISNHEAWRKKMGVDEMNKTGYDFPEREKVNEIYPQFYHKTDIDGRPLYIERLGSIDRKKLVTIFGDDARMKERLLKRLIFEYERFIIERLPACSIKQGGEPIETSCTILDLKNVGLTSAWKVFDLIQEATAVGQDQYPECMGKFYVVNAPFLFDSLWGAVKKFLDPVTTAKINILGRNYKAELTKQVPPENLPADLGGSCSCQGGCSLADQGPWKDADIMAKVEKQRAEKAQKIAESDGKSSSATGPQIVPPASGDLASADGSQLGAAPAPA